MTGLLHWPVSTHCGLIRGLVVFYLERYFRRPVGFPPNEGHRMATPEKLLGKRRHQIMNDEIDKPDASTKHEDSWIRDFIDRLAGAIRKIGSSS